MQVTVNGEKREFSRYFTISELLEKLEIPNKLIAVELNKEIVRKKDWKTISIKDADKIEIVYFVGGG